MHWDSFSAQIHCWFAVLEQGTRVDTVYHRVYKLMEHQVHSNNIATIVNTRFLQSPKLVRAFLRIHHRSLYGFKELSA